MATGGVSDGLVVGDKYRSHLSGDGEKNTQWRHGGPPNYDVVNKLFEEGRTQEWPKGSLEETVQDAIKTWEMELSYKTRLQDFKTISPSKFRFFVNGRRGLSGEETLQLGSYNALLQSSLPEEYQTYYKPHEETFESSHEVFRRAFPRGFAWEVLGVYSGPPVITFKFRHWGVMEGPYKGHAPTGELVQFSGVAILKVDEQLKAEKVEIFYDPGELFGGLLKGPAPAAAASSGDASIAQSCPFFQGGKPMDVTENREEPKSKIDLFTQFVLYCMQLGCPQDLICSVVSLRLSSSFKFDFSKMEGFFNFRGLWQGFVLLRTVQELSAAY